MRAKGLGGFLATKVVAVDDGKGGTAQRRVYITREARCGCGADFRQYHLSRRFLVMCENWNQGGAMREVQKQIPEFYVPVHCPKCERKQIGLESKRSEIRDWSRDNAPARAEGAA